VNPHSRRSRLRKNMRSPYRARPAGKRTAQVRADGRPPCERLPLAWLAAAWGKTPGAAQAHGPAGAWRGYATSALDLLDALPGFVKPRLVRARQQGRGGSGSAGRRTS